MVTLVCQAGIAAQRFEPDELFALGSNNMASMSTKLHKELAILVWTIPAKYTAPLATSMAAPCDCQMKP